jgi:hypothetical protein
MKHPVKKGDLFGRRFLVWPFQVRALNLNSRFSSSSSGVLIYHKTTKLVFTVNVNGLACMQDINSFLLCMHD